MRELAYWLSGFGAWGITLWIAKRFVQVQILDAISHAAKASERAELAFRDLSKEVGDLKISAAISHANLRREFLELRATFESKNSFAGFPHHKNNGNGILEE